MGPGNTAEVSTLLPVAALRSRRFECFWEARRRCREGSPIAFVVGNVRYDGVPFPVDEYTAEVGEVAGLECAET